MWPIRASGVGPSANVSAAIQDMSSVGMEMWLQLTKKMHPAVAVWGVTDLYRASTSDLYRNASWLLVLQSRWLSVHRWDTKSVPIVLTDSLLQLQVSWVIFYIVFVSYVLSFRQITRFTLTPITSPPPFPSIEWKGNWKQWFYISKQIQLHLSNCHGFVFLPTSIFRWWSTRLYS